MNNVQQPIFNQIKQILPFSRLNQLIGQHKSDRFAKNSSTSNLLSLLLYAQITKKTSLRDIETCLEGHKALLYHSGFESIKRSTLSYWNNYKVPSEIFETLFYELLSQLKHNDRTKKFNFPNKLYSLDSTTIPLALSVFDRAKFRKRKWAVKLHTLLENESFLPELIVFSTGKFADNKIAFWMFNKLDKWSIVVFDRYYIDFKLRKEIDEKELFFVVRTKTNTNYCPIENLEKWEENILYDKKVELLKSDADYKKTLRVVRYYYEEEDKNYEYITNNFDLSATQIAFIYKSRREIETFFKWIKQNLKIKTFLWTSENAVRNQIWIAMIYYLIVHFIAYQAKISKKWILKLTRLLWEFCMSRRSIIELLRVDNKSKLKNIRDWPIQNRLFLMQ